MTFKSKEFKNKFFGSLAGNTLRLFSANVGIQAISFFTLPFFARVYLPSDYGVWGVFMFISGFIAVVSCLRYELAVMIPKDDVEARQLVISSQSVNTIFLAVFLLIAFLFSGFLSGITHITALPYILLIPVHAFFTAYNNLMIQWVSRQKLFNHLVAIRSAQSLLNIFLSFVFGYLFQMGYKGLVLSTVLSIITVDLALAFKYKINLFTYGNSAQLKEMLFKYSSFAKYSSPLALLNYGTGNILYYILQSGFGSVVTGFYTNAVRLIQTPFSMISSSFAPVFYQHFSKSTDKPALMIKSFLSLLILFTALLLPFLIAGKEIITWYMGSNWAAVSDYIIILSGITVLSFSMSCISTVFAFYQKERITLIWQILYLIATIAVFVIAGSDLTRALWMYSVTGAIAYLVLFFIAYLLVKKEKNYEVVS